MKYTIIGILAVASILLIWIFRTGTIQDFLIMLVAIVSVTFFASIDNIWNYLYPSTPRSGKVTKPGETIVVKLPRNRGE